MNVGCLVFCIFPILVGFLAQFTECLEYIINHTGRVECLHHIPAKVRWTHALIEHIRWCLPVENVSLLAKIGSAILLIGKAKQFQGIILQVGLCNHLICDCFICMVGLLRCFQPIHQSEKQGCLIRLLAGQFQTSLQCMQTRPVGHHQIAIICNEFACESWIGVISHRTVAIACKSKATTNEHAMDQEMKNIYRALGQFSNNAQSVSAMLDKQVDSLPLRMMPMFFEQMHCKIIENKTLKCVIVIYMDGFVFLTAARWHR